MLGKRIITALIGMAFTVFIVNYGQAAFAYVVLALTILAWQEFCAILRKRDIKAACYLGLIPVVLLWATAWMGNAQETVAVLLFGVFCVLAKTVFFPEQFSVSDAMFTVGGIFYVGFPFSHLVLLRFTDSYLFIATDMGTLQAGAVYLWLAFIGTWSSDTIAYFVGVNFGKHKLAPAVSPSKTWEGTVGGVFGSFVGLLVTGVVFHLSLLHSGAIGILVGLVAPLGDLVESSLKRYAGVKDSGRILPGHGGILDRFDSIMFAVPLVYYYLYFVFLQGGQLCKTGLPY